MYHSGELLVIVVAEILSGRANALSRSRIPSEAPGFLGVYKSTNLGFPLLLTS
jgi:hypothetical protein